MSFSIRAVTSDDWASIRDIRLRMLEDTPLAYAETLADARKVDERGWRERGRRGQNPYATSLAAIAEDGTWIAMMGGFVSEERGPVLVGVYVDAAWRGRDTGVADAVLGTVEDWARTVGDTLTLDVHEANPRAIAFYRRHGFDFTGNTHPYGLPPYGREREMRKAL